jgi:hypothetical protein
LVLVVDFLGFIEGYSQSYQLAILAISQENRLPMPVVDMDGMRKRRVERREFGVRAPPDVQERT